MNHTVWNYINSTEYFLNICFMDVMNWTLQYLEYIIIMLMKKRQNEKTKWKNSRTRKIILFSTFDKITQIQKWRSSLRRTRRTTEPWIERVKSSELIDVFLPPHIVRKRSGKTSLFRTWGTPFSVTFSFDSSPWDTWSLVGPPGRKFYENETCQDVESFLSYVAKETLLNGIQSST